MAYAAAKACYHSIGAYNGQLVVLGSKMIHVYAIRNWMARIDNLVKHNQWDRAFALALSFYKGEARAVVGLAGSQEHKKQLVADKIVGELLCMCLCIGMTVFFARFLLGSLFLIFDVSSLF